MKVEAVFVGKPQRYIWRNELVRTSIFKTPVLGPVKLCEDHLEGDQSANEEVHGGEFAAVYSYAEEHYSYWKERLGRQEFIEYGSFGENLVTVGLDETQVCTGDVYAIGETRLQATQPRIPCKKLAIRLSEEPDEIIPMFYESGRWGVFWRVLETGNIEAGMRIRLFERDPAQIPLSFYMNKTNWTSQPDITRAVLAHEAVHPVWRERLQKALDKVEQKAQ